MADLKVHEPIGAVEDMRKDWHLPETLLGGTRAMREAGITYLPRFKSELHASWIARRDRSFLFNAYESTLTRLSEKPFAREASFTADSSDFYQDLSKDFDGQGTSLSAFLCEAMTLAIHRGLVHAYTDTPSLARPATLAEEQDLGLTPYAVLVDPNDVLGWRSEVFGGSRVLTQVRIREVSIEADGPYGERSAERVRVFNHTPGRVNEDGASATWELWERPEGSSSQYEPIDAGVIELGRIPMQTFYTNRSGFMTGKPALMSLAEKNLEHWQSASDQRNILHTARTPILFGRMVKWDADSVGLGSGTAWQSDHPDSDVKWVEHSGAAIGAGNTDLDNIEDAMVALGLQPLIERTGSTTATEHAIQSSESNASLKSWTRRLKTFGEGLAADMAEWSGRNHGEPSIDIHQDFGVTLRDSKDVSALVAAYDSDMPVLSRETVQAELKRRGVLSEDFDSEMEAERLRRELARRRRTRRPIEPRRPAPDPGTDPDPDPDPEPDDE